MLFKSLRRLSSRSGSKSTTPTSPNELKKSTTATTQSSVEDNTDYQKFLWQAQVAEEKAEKRRLKELKMAEKQMKQVNMSPWESRM